MFLIRHYFVRNVSFSLSHHHLKHACTHTNKHTHIIYTQRITKAYIFNLYVKNDAEIIMISENKELENGHFYS